MTTEGRFCAAGGQGFEAKKELRRSVKTAVKALSAEEKHRLSQEIWAAVEAGSEFDAAETVLIYCSLPDEVETADFIARWYGRKRIVVPLVTGDRLTLKEYKPCLMRPGAFGILEPSAEAKTVNPAEIDLAFIPGVAFSSTSSDPNAEKLKSGVYNMARPFWRLGRGKGFYDRLLPSLTCPTVGICFPCQVVASLPADPWDIPVACIIAGKR